MKPSLLILAAGMASRYGGMKQIEEFGPDGETIMDYSIYDAIRAGFGKIVFVIREEFAPQFKSIFDPKLKGRVEVEYVYQHLDSYINEFEKPADRTKPWGTAHAVLCAEKVIHEPFAVINADDFYGYDSFVKAYTFLTDHSNSKNYSIIAYELGQTLSDHGTVNRGVCSIDDDGNLIAVEERLNISRHDDGVMANDGLIPHYLALDTMVSMNFWCFTPSVFEYIKILFQEFLQEKGGELKSEFFIPLVADQFIKRFGGRVEVIATTAIWFGVTYKADAPIVKKSIDTLVNSEEYPSGLWK
jgi:UTP-glucose-1-phosphate uridylyltransferase